MARFAIDSSALMRIVSDDVAIDPSHRLVAPSAVRSEALDRLLPDVRAGRVPREEASRIHERLTELQIRLLGDRVSRRVAWDLALEHGWDSMRDAEYIAIARLQADALIALDPSLQARATGIVPLRPFDALFTDG
ncbi:MAG TPA: hypothetical protein VMH41_04900 [Mycobacteriales bacterium]|nr:hypothetical protein [Mycobacteriales bacterium]